jgi:hypothetical protein
VSSLLTIHWQSPALLVVVLFVSRGREDNSLVEIARRHWHLQSRRIARFVVASRTHPRIEALDACPVPELRRPRSCGVSPCALCN